jgi:hypothetical protein
MTCHWGCNKSNTTDATNGAGISYPSGAPEFTSVLVGVHVAPSLVFYVVFCILLFVLLSFFFSQLYCLSFYLRLLIIFLVVS